MVAAVFLVFRPGPAFLVQDQQSKLYRSQAHRIFHFPPFHYAPSSLASSQFEHLCLLCEGRMAYFGAASASVDYFERRGFTCPAHYNPGRPCLCALQPW